MDYSNSWGYHIPFQVLYQKRKRNRVIEKKIRAIKCASLLVDGISISGKTEESQRQNFNEVFDRLRVDNIEISKKMKFLRGIKLFMVVKKKMTIIPIKHMKKRKLF